MIDRTDFAVLMRFLTKSYPGRMSCDQETIEAYYMILGDLPLDLVRAAALDYVGSDEKWPPGPGQIRGAAFRLMEEKSDTGRSAGEAWAEVKRRVRDWFPQVKRIVGWGDDGPIYQDYGPHLFDDPLAFDALEAVGGPGVFLLPGDVEHTTRARFMDAYNTLLQRARHNARLLPQVREVVNALSDGGIPALDSGKGNNG